MVNGGTVWNTGDFIIALLQIVIGNSWFGVVNMMKADVAGEPLENFW